tara:strand:- start:1344 stop:1754 length:411 start_codon:yes stop_codon:yes gene_type:complete
MARRDIDSARKFKAKTDKAAKEGTLDSLGKYRRKMADEMYEAHLSKKGARPAMYGARKAKKGVKPVSPQGNPADEAVKRAEKEYEIKERKRKERNKGKPKKTRRKKLSSKMRKGGSISYGSGSVRSYSKKYPGMGG